MKRLRIRPSLERCRFGLAYNRLYKKTHNYLKDDNLSSFLFKLWLCLCYGVPIVLTIVELFLLVSGQSFEMLNVSFNKGTLFIFICIFVVILVSFNVMLYLSYSISDSEYIEILKYQNYKNEEKLKKLKLKECLKDKKAQKIVADFNLTDDLKEKRS